MLVVPDTSEFQRAGDGSFNREAWIFRVMFGNGYLDPRFLANANEAKALYDAHRISGAILYTVYLGSQSVASQYAATWKAIGPTVPPWLLGIMIDVEHWGGQSYAISGNHSTQLNQLYGMHAHRMGSWNGCIGYGNRGDLASIWPQRDPRCRVILADYSGRLTYTSVKGAIGQQYTNGQYAAPGGMPTSSNPFGHCDHNALNFKNGAALRSFMRPAPPKPKPAAKPTPPHPHYPHANLSAYGHAVVSRNGAWAETLEDDGSKVLWNNGTAVRRTPA